MAVTDLLTRIAWTTTQINLIALALFALSWALGSAIKGSPIPFREWKEFGNGIRMDALKAAFELALWSGISALIGWIAVAISSSL
jgi:hypothetical protein